MLAITSVLCSAISAAQVRGLWLRVCSRNGAWSKVCKCSWIVRAQFSVFVPGQAWAGFTHCVHASFARCTQSPSVARWDQLHHRASQPGTCKTAGMQMSPKEIKWGAQGQTVISLDNDKRLQMLHLCTSNELGGYLLWTLQHQSLFSNLCTGCHAQCLNQSNSFPRSTLNLHIVVWLTTFVSLLFLYFKWQLVCHSWLCNWCRSSLAGLHYIWKKKISSLQMPL